MKLVLCKNCQDVIRLIDEERKCRCGNVSGRYLDEIHAEYSGEYAVPIGFANSTLVHAVHNQPESGIGETFEAFVIPKECPTFKISKK
jgi:hypothetical protein